MSELSLVPLRCPQCGAPGLAREATRMTECERCGIRLCLTETPPPRYEVQGRLTPTRAAAMAEEWLKGRGLDGSVRRPELVLVPFHEFSGRRAGVVERKVPDHRRVERVRHAQSDAPQLESRWVRTEKEDTKVLLADIHHLTVAAQTPWDLRAFHAREARRTATLKPFELAEAQRRATVYDEDRSAAAAVSHRFREDVAETVAATQRTLFFPFWLVPVQHGGVDYEVLLDGLTGATVAWRLPEPYPAARLPWLVVSSLGALALGHGIRGLFLGDALVDPAIALAAGVTALAVALWQTARPDWRLHSWPEPDTVIRHR